jgi:molybdopterin molybdotransferase
MLQLEEARERILAAVRPLPRERVELLDAAQRIIADDVAAPLDLPAFDNSAMDGYAVLAADLHAASSERPVRLKITAHIPAGANQLGALATGQCARIFTGSPLPPGADAVVMQEDVTCENDVAVFHEPPKPWDNIRFRGEDVKHGSVVARVGDRVTAGMVALLGGLGIAEVPVRRRPIVAMLATGNELCEGTSVPANGTSTPASGQIYESNRAALATLLAAAGAVPRLLPLVPDTLDASRDALRRAFEESDIVVTTGGVSVGELDFVKDAFRQLGGKREFWRVAIRPGKPFVFGSFDDKLFFGLPGNPVSAFVTAAVLVWPVILRAQGATETELPSHYAVANDTFVNKSDRRHFMRVRVDAQGGASLSGLQASHALSSLAVANGLIDVPAGAVIERGARVKVLRFPA